MNRRGYTVVELLMAVTIFAIGVTGIIAMQKVTVSANQHAKELAIATHVAQAWQEQLTADAAAWNHPSPKKSAEDLDETRWLVNAVGNTGVWFRPTYVPELKFGPAFDALGRPIENQNDLAQARYCTHIRLSWLYPDNAGNGLLRAEVRVFWLRDGGGGTVNNATVCDPTTDPAVIEAATDRYHFVYQTTAIKQNTAI
ncbi:MAG: prepilin-type N-terminal cleavage/methylation domain-containing protein [Myxococcales bacterium]|nr:prepilin-type N-terminal cleavage/methylation domain-containing protein [Myxococcales bacterium]MCB9577816.1 prepilin-type N-terminal cleavage/methylation domain-containing protein [Polyangiaceae bacterium]